MEGKTFYGEFHFEPWVQIDSFEQMETLCGNDPWNSITMSRRQLKQYALLMNQTPKKAMTFKGIPIKIYD